MIVQQLWVTLPIKFRHSDLLTMCIIDKKARSFCRLRFVIDVLL